MELSGTLELKLEHLYRYLSELESVLVCYSGGLNSTLLLYASRKVLGDNAEAIYFNSPIIPYYLQREAAEEAKLLNVKLTVVAMPSLNSSVFYSNPENRCHLCKHGFITKSLNMAARFDINAVVDGTTGESPGRHCQNKISIKGLSVKSPFDELGITKVGIRTISRYLALSTWNKSPFFCLMTHFKHGTIVDEKMLLTVELAENFLNTHGFKYYKVWHDGKIAKLKLGANETIAAIGKMRKNISDYFKTLGFESAYVLDYHRPKDMSEIKIF